MLTYSKAYRFWISDKISAKKFWDFFDVNECLTQKIVELFEVSRLFDNLMCREVDEEEISLPRIHLQINAFYLSAWVNAINGRIFEWRTYSRGMFNYGNYKISKELRGPGFESYRGCQIDGCHDKFKTSTETLNTEIYESVLNRLASARWKVIV